jgi:hypothetical protein
MGPDTPVRCRSFACIADPAQPQHLKQGALVGTRKQRAPAEGVGEHRHEPVRDDPDQARANHRDGGDQIAGSVVGDQAEEQRDAGQPQGVESDFHALGPPACR